MRSYGRLGIQVGAIMGRPFELRSRYCRDGYQIPAGIDAAEYFATRLLDEPLPAYRGAVVLATGDDGVAFVARNRAALGAAGYLLEHNDPTLTLDLLDKRRTLQLASAVGLPTPAYWPVDPETDLDEVGHTVDYPVLLKPVDTHRHHARFGSKFRLAHGPRDLLVQAAELNAAGMAFVVCEKVPGPDDLTCSYYTYRDASGRELMGFTKRVIRRRPLNEGAGTFQLTADLPEVAALARRFFDAVEYRGFGNLEFKRDPRTGELKVMECNTRVTAPQEQLLASGTNADLIIYRDLTGQEVTPSAGAREGVAMWMPGRDVQAFQELRSVTGASWLDYLRSIRARRYVLPYFRFSDPGPAAALAAHTVGRVLNRYRS